MLPMFLHFDLSVLKSARGLHSGWPCTFKKNYVGDFMWREECATSWQLFVNLYGVSYLFCVYFWLELFAYVIYAWEDMNSKYHVRMTWLLVWVYIRCQRAEILKNGTVVLDCCIMYLTFVPVCFVFLLHILFILFSPIL